MKEIIQKIKDFIEKWQIKKLGLLGGGIVALFAGWIIIATVLFTLFINSMWSTIIGWIKS
jgi:hypothetical protein